jgi:hypothetical protein
MNCTNNGNECCAKSIQKGKMGDQHYMKYPNRYRINIVAPLTTLSNISASFFLKFCGIFQ